jgi:hypothetical protein
MWLDILVGGCVGCIVAGLVRWVRQGRPVRPRASVAETWQAKQRARNDQWHLPSSLG